MKSKINCSIFNLFVFIFCSLSLQAQVTTTKLKDPNHIDIFIETTSKIRCICLPSLPIQACSFNMCAASSYLKSFIENRIKDGMSAETIVNKMENGFGESILTDPVILHFKEEGNQGMVDSIVYGFGPNILAKPDSTWINATLFLFGILGISLILFYFKKFRKSSIELTSPNSGKTHNTSDIQNRIRSYEDKEN